MNRNPYELVEQRAIELMSSLGQEHLFVANCPSHLDADKYASNVITYEEAFDHCSTGVGLCLLLPRAYALQKFVDMCLQKDTSLHFVFTCPSNTCEFEAAAWIYNLLQEKVQHVGFMQNLGITCDNGRQEKYIIACQIEPNAAHCRIDWTSSCRTLEYVFPRQVMERQHTVEALQKLPEVTYIDFRRPNGCHRISDQVDVSALTVQINSESLKDLELVERCIQPTIDAAWEHDLAECQVKQFFPWNDKHFQQMFPHGVTMSVVDLKSCSNIAVSEILAQLAHLKVRYYFMKYKRLAIFGPPSLVINLHVALLPVDVQLPIGPKQGAFTIHIVRPELKDDNPGRDRNHLCVKFGKIGSFQYVPVQVTLSELHPSMLNHEQIDQSPVIQILQQHLGAVNFFTRWCQVNLAQQRCLCFDIEVQHEDTLPIAIESDMHPIVVHHQCPSAEGFRAEVSLTEYETRRDHWNNVIAQQMIPKEGRVSHISFEQDKKQSARRYYDLSSTVVDLLPDYTNVITISPQPPSWFFSPKVIALPLRECLREVNYCDNSFIQEVFTSATHTSALKLQTHEFPKYKNHTRWTFFHVNLSPEQCFRLKSIHHEKEEWKVRFYDELIIRTFERASLFITLPPGISLSQLIDNNQFCTLKEAFTYSDPNQYSFDATVTATGTSEQYRSSLPHKQSLNGAGLINKAHVPKNSIFTTPVGTHQQRYCPPVRSTRPCRGGKQSTGEDVDMTPSNEVEPSLKVDTPKMPSVNNHHLTNLEQPDCGMTVPDSPTDSAIAATPRPTAIEENLANLETQQPMHVNHQATPQNVNADQRADNIDTTHQSDPNSTTPHPLPNQTHHKEAEDATGGYSWLASNSPNISNHIHDKDRKSLLLPPMGTSHKPPPSDQIVVIPKVIPNIAVTAANNTESPPGQPNGLTAKMPSAPHPNQASVPVKDTSAAQPRLQGPTIKDCLQRNMALQPLNQDKVLSIEDDDVIFVPARATKSMPTIDRVLLQSDHDGTRVNVCKAIIAGWPQSFAHADNTYLAKLAACYSIQFQSYMCYAVTALRTLAHAPWKDEMFFGHIRELVLCAIGNGWTWSDQSASVQGRRISTVEVCAAIASYNNLRAFPPGQVSDLDTAIIAVCDDLFLEHVNLFFATFKIECISCNAQGSATVSVFDTLLIRSPENREVLFQQMLTNRTPRLALDREDVDFAHSADCTNSEHLRYLQAPEYLTFTLKITCPLECLPCIAEVVELIEQTFDVHPLNNNAESRPFTVTGILTVQGNTAHHFVVIEKYQQQQVLIYDNLSGYKWLPISDLPMNSKAWGFILRKQDHRQYTFQPSQYKAIAPDVRKLPEPSSGRKSGQGKATSTLGVNAKKYNCPPLPGKPSKNVSKTDNQPTPAHCTTPQEEQNTSISEIQQEQPKPETQVVQHDGNAHGGVLIVGQTPIASDGTNHPTDIPSESNQQHGHPGVLRVGDAPTDEPHNSARMHRAHSNLGDQAHVHEKAADVVSDANPSGMSQAVQSRPPWSTSNNECNPAPPVQPGDDATGPSDSAHPPAIGGNELAQDESENLGIDEVCLTAAPVVIPLLKVPTSGTDNTTETPRTDNDLRPNPVSAVDGPPNNASPPKRLRFSERHPYAIISLFDGVGSAIPAITKAIGGPPKLIIAAECDPILRQLVAEQFQFRTDGSWTQSSAATFTLYTHDVKELLRDHCRILREAFAIAGTQCRWIVIAGSPCQDLTLAGPFKGLLGLTGQSSSLFYYVHVILWLLQTNYPTELIRFLLENAGTMLEIHRKAILRALGLNPDANPDYFRVDPKHTHGIKRNRFYFRNYTDRDHVQTSAVLNHDDGEGPLLDQGGVPIPFGPLLRVRTVLGHQVFQLSWTSYQPISLIWDYSFWGNKHQFQAQAKMQCSDTIPALDFTNSLPPHYLRAWKQFLGALKNQDISPSDRDNLVRAILPIFHHPFITAPMRILTCEEIEKLAGLHNHFHRVHTHRPLLTEYTIRNYCGNSFHPEHIQAAIGHPERLRNWLAEPAEPKAKPTWTGVIHPKEARTQYHQLRDQVQTIAQQRRIKDVAQKQVGLDPMPDFPVHAIEGNLAPSNPTIQPIQLPPPSRRIHPEEIGLCDDQPPAQLSAVAVRVIQQHHMQEALTGMRFFGAGISLPVDIFPFVFSAPAENVMDAHQVQNKQYFMQRLDGCPQCAHSMAQILLLLFAITQRERSSIHIVHVSDWEDNARIVAFGNVPSKWTIYCVQFPKSQAFHIDTIAWHCRTRMNIPWQSTFQLQLCDTPVPFRCTNEQCEWFAVPHGHKRFLVSSAKLGDFLYQGCIPCFFAWLIPHVSCPAHLKPSANIETAGTVFVDNEGNTIAAAAQPWPSAELTGRHALLAKATITDQLEYYASHQSELPHVTAIGRAHSELVQSWIAEITETLEIYFVLSR